MGRKSKLTLRLVQLVTSIIVIAIIVTSCVCDPQSHTSTTISSGVSQTETEQRESIPPATEPIENETRVFEKIHENSMLTVIGGENNAVVLGREQSIIIPGVLDSVEYAAGKPRATMLLDKRKSDAGRLVFVDGAETIEVAANVSSYFFSNDGRSIAYVLESLSDGDGGDLYVYDCATGNSRLISENAGRYFTLSPTGNAIAYIVYDEPGNPYSWLCKVSVGEEIPNTIERDIYPVALKDDGSLVYALRLEIGEDGEIINNNFSVFHDSDETLLSEGLYAATYMEILFNYDCTQVLYSDSSGICFFQDGEESIVIEPHAKLAFNNKVCLTKGWSVDDHIQFFSEYSGTNNLYNLLQMIVYDDPNYANLWYFLEGGESVVLTSIWRKTGFAEEGGSILARNQDGLIYINDIYSSVHEYAYDTSVEKRIGDESGAIFLLTKDKTIFYSSNPGTYENNYRFELSSVPDNDDSATVLISKSCVWVERYENEVDPDIVFYLEYSKPDSVENEMKYVNMYYYNLYAIEDVPGANPYLIAENVGDFGVGDYGVYYLQLKEVAPVLIQYYSGKDDSYDEDHSLTDMDLYDVNEIYYSSDGITFEYLADIGRRYLYAS